MNYVVTLNLGNFIPANVRASMIVAALRWDAEFVEITSPLPGVAAEDVFGFKIRLYDLDLPGAAADARVLWLDGDCIVRSDCPSPFDLVPPECFGGVLNFQGDTHGGDPWPTHEPHWRQCARGAGVAHPYDPARYINGGVMLWTPERHAHLWRWVEQVLDRRGLSGGLVGGLAGPLNPMTEQTMLNVAIAELGIPLHLLPREFNRLGAAAWGPPDGWRDASGDSGCPPCDQHGYALPGARRMDAYILHLANLGPLRSENYPGGKRAALADINWTVVPEQVQGSKCKVQG